MRPETQDTIQVLQDLQEELKRVTAERDALARHIEAFNAPVTLEDLGEAHTTFNRKDELRPVLEQFIERRQKAGQFKAFG